MYRYHGFCPYGHTSNFQHRSVDNPDMSVLSEEEELHTFTTLLLVIFRELTSRRSSYVRSYGKFYLPLG